MGIEKNYLVNSLLEFYGPLLTRKQRSYMRDYYVNDFSLGEISQNFRVSRQAVYDNLNRTERTLEKYEERLHLYRNFLARNHLIDRIQLHVNQHYSHDQQLKMMIKRLEHLENR